MAVNLSAIDLCLKAMPQAGVFPHVSVSHAHYTGNDRDGVNCNLSHDKELFIEAIIVGELLGQGGLSERGLKADGVGSRSNPPDCIQIKTHPIMQQGSVTKKNKFKAFLNIIHLSVGALGCFEILMNVGESCSWSDHKRFPLTSDNRRVIPPV